MEEKKEEREKEKEKEREKATRSQRPEKKTRKKKTSQWLDAVPELRNTISSFSQRPLPLGEARQAPHVFVMGSSSRLAPVIRWDGMPVSDGMPSIPVLRLRELLDKDRDPVEGDIGIPGYAGAATQRKMHVDVPYGFMTGMTTLPNGEYS